MAKEKRPLVILSIFGSPKHDMKTRNEIAKWLRDQADSFIIWGKEKYSSRFIARYYE